MAVFSDGAETTASRFVICESVSVVAFIASSTSLRISDSSIRGRASAEAGRRSGGVDDVALAGVGGHPPRRDVRVGEEPVLLKQREFVADRRRAAVEARVAGDRS